MAKSMKDEMNSIPEQLETASARIKEYAETGAARAKEGYENARKATTKASLTVLDIVKEDADAAYAVTRDLINAKSLSDVFSIHMAYLKDRYEVRVSQAQEFGAFLKQSAEEAATPIRDGLSKVFPELKKVA